MSETAIIVTTINAPTPALMSLSQGAEEKGWRLIIIGDTATPSDFSLPYGDYFNVEQQKRLGFALGEIAPTRSYARKNIGYLIALRDGATTLIETDDDNAPLDSFWSERSPMVQARNVTGTGWKNVYRVFSDENIWPRGLPLSEIREVPRLEADLVGVHAPVQQGLANGDPDVDAIYRMVLQAGDLTFREAPPVALPENVWCPTNSQNTTWFPEAFPVLYIPFTCSMRACDIWRGLVSQPWVWGQAGQTVFHSATVFQDRNPHDLMRDFRDEVSVFLGAESFPSLAPPRTETDPWKYLRGYYAALTNAGLVDEKEMLFLDAWIEDLERLI